MGTDKSTSKRLYYLDNIRSFVIFFVILQHAALIYARYDGTQNISQTIYRFIIGFTDIFMMPMLFFIAGYFALASIRKQGPQKFLRSKFLRIWIPWLKGLFLLLPLSVYFLDMLKQLRAGSEVMAFGDHFMNFMAIIFTPHTGFVKAGQLSPRHLWFLSVLFAFFVLFTLLYVLSGKIISKQHDKEHSSSKIIIALITAGVLSAVFYFMVSFAIGWGYKPVSIFNIVYSDCARTSSYVVYFILGLYAFKGKWFSAGNMFHGAKYWYMASFASFALYLFTDFYLELGNSTETILIRSLVRATLVLCLIVLMLDIFSKYFNTRKAISGTMADNSYTVYIIHYVLHGAIAVLISFLPAPSLIKMSAVFLLTCVLSYGVSIFAVRPHPRLSALFMAVLTGILLIVF